MRARVALLLLCFRAQLVLPVPPYATSRGRRGRKQPDLDVRSRRGRRSGPGDGCVAFVSRPARWLKPAPLCYSHCM
ncbi:hypothetical protein C8J57DRAFT_1333030 [Mycena rebaudengoi]|nr:hypothetical protein C8J57DRAFT_1333030 [Mycena rebaudengoi]